MSFNTALSGLQAASVDLSVTSNNIANVSTTGFKYSRTEFGDIFAVSPFGSSATAVGKGVRIGSVSQQFQQGNLQFTDSNLDLAVSGQGYFITNQNQTGGTPSYTRAGNFRVDANRFVTNNDGQYLMAFPVDAQGAVTSTSLNTTAPLQLPASTGAPQATTEIEVGVNLPANSPGLDRTLFDPSSSATFTSSTSSTVYDSFGESHVMSYYFVKDNLAANQWAVFNYLDGQPIDINTGTTITHPNGSPPVATAQDAAILNFNSDGTLATTTPDPIANTAIVLPNGATALTVTHDFANNNTTQYASSFSAVLDPDGFSTGQLTGLDISEDGLVRSTFSNGTAIPLGKIAIADFPNSQGLRNIGSASWAETVDSGSVITGEGGTGRLGLIQSGALEASNVDLTSQLVNLITAQRNFQANARSIETSNTLTQTVIQIR